MKWLRKRSVKVIIAWAIVSAAMSGLYFLRRNGWSEIRKEAMAADCASVSFVSNTVKAGTPIRVAAINYPANMDFSYLWSVGYDYIDNDMSYYIPTEEDYEKFITVTVTPQDPSYPSQQIWLYFSKLPVMYINTDDGIGVTSKVEYKGATLRIQGNEQFSEEDILYDGRIQIKGRGNSTWNNSDKKSMHIKLDRATDLFGMGKENDWLMLANAFDVTQMRNALAYNLSGDMGLVKIDSTWAVVVLNYEYFGLYQICEKIEASPSRIDITSWRMIAKNAAKVLVKAGIVPEELKGQCEETMKTNLSWITDGFVDLDGERYAIPDFITTPALTGGVVMELDMFYDRPSKFAVGNQHFVFKDPKYANTNENLFGYTQEYVSAFYEAAMDSKDFFVDYQGKELHYSDLFDLESLVSYYLVQEIFFNEDGTAKSCFFYKDVDDLARMGPVWDMDWSAGGEGENAALFDQWQTVFYSNYDQIGQWYKGLVKDPYFLSIVLEKWEQYREDIYDLIADDGDIDRIEAYIGEAAKINGIRWPYRNGYVAETDYLKDWLTNRLEWMDSQMTSLQHLEESIGSYHYGKTVEIELSRDRRNVSAYCGDTEAAYAIFYINAMKSEQSALDEGTVVYEIPEGSFCNPEDVLQVRIYNESGEVIGQTYVDNRF